MNFIIDKKEIISLLSDFTIILKENSVRPVLSGIYIEAKNNKLTLMGTNLENDLIKVVDAKVMQEGTVVIKPALILEYIKQLDVDEIEFKLKDDILYIHSAEFLVLSGENYPEVKKYNGKDVAKKITDIFSMDKQTILVLGDKSIEPKLKKLTKKYGKLTILDYKNYL